LAKAQREVAECQSFRELSDQLLDVNEQICQLRPVEETSPSAQERNGRLWAAAQDFCGCRPGDESVALTETGLC
jgi:hypothetical protein